MELIAPCHFGLEAVLKREIDDLGYDVSEVSDGRITFIGDAEAIARVNIWSRTAERILLKVGEFDAYIQKHPDATNDEIYQALTEIREKVTEKHHQQGDDGIDEE